MDKLSIDLDYIFTSMPYSAHKKGNARSNELNKYIIPTSLRWDTILVFSYPKYIYFLFICPNESTVQADDKNQAYIMYFEIFPK